MSPGKKAERGSNGNLRESYRGGGTKLFLVVPDDVTRRNGYKCKVGRFRLDI